MLSKKNLLAFRSRESFDLREQVGKPIVTELAVFPADIDAGTVLGNDFALCSVGGPDDHFMELEGLGFLGIHREQPAVRFKVISFAPLRQLFKVL
jgi:hypothetical protein